MATRSEKVTVFICNACGKEEVQFEGEELPMGFHLDVFHIHGTGGDGGKVFACSEKCIKKAVLNYRTEDNGYSI